MKLFDPTLNEVNFSRSKATMGELPVNSVPGLQSDEEMEAMGAYRPPGTMIVVTSGINSSNPLVRDAMREDF